MEEEAAPAGPVSPEWLSQLPEAVSQRLSLHLREQGYAEIMIHLSGARSVFDVIEYGFPISSVCPVDTHLCWPLPIASRFLIKSSMEKFLLAAQKSLSFEALDSFSSLTVPEAFSIPFQRIWAASTAAFA